MFNLHLFCVIFMFVSEKNAYIKDLNALRSKREVPRGDRNSKARRQDKSRRDFNFNEFSMYLFR